MFDYIIFFLFKLSRKDIIVDPVSFSIEVYGDLQDKDVTLIFTHWHSSLAASKRIVRKLGPNKHAIVARMHSALSLDFEEVLAEHLKLRADIEEKLKKNNLRVERIIGVSIGNIHVGYFAEKYKPRYIDLVSPGLSLADCFWTGIGTRKYRNIYELRGATFKQLRNAWRELSFSDYCSFVEDARIEIRIWDSKADKLIRYENSVLLLKQLRSDNLKNIDHRTNRFLGHYLTLLRVWAFWRPNKL